MLASLIRQESLVQIWIKPLADGSHAVLLFNGGDTKADLTVHWGRDLKDVSKPYEREVTVLCSMSMSMSMSTCECMHESGN